MTKLPFFFLLLLLPLISGEIQTLKFDSDSQPLIKLDRFGFTHTGHVTISVSSASVLSAVGSPDLSQLGFFLLPEESKSTVQPNLSICLRSHYIDLLFAFRDLSPPSFNYTHNVTSAGEYSLYFSNCAPQSTVSMSVRTELYNIDYRGVKEFLSPGLAELPLLYCGLSIVYFAFSSLWIYVCARNRESVHRIHSLMAIFLIMKALNFLAEAEVLQYVKVTGTCRGWDVVFYVLQFVNVVYWFALAVLQQAGWSLMQPFLQEREKIDLMIVMLLQVGACVANKPNFQ